MPYERDNIHALDAYTPGEQPRERQVVKLNTNENPYPPAPQVMEAIAAVTPEDLRRYPPPLATPFREVAAEVHGLSPNQVIATNGGDELLRMMLTVFCEPRPNAKTGSHQAFGGLGLVEPSYTLYPVLAKIHDTPVTYVPLTESFDLPDDLADRWNDAGCRLGIVVNPHAPTGKLRSNDALAEIAERFDGVLLVDQAYIDFASGDSLSLLDPTRGLDNVLLLRTMSKGYSLAGLRFGYGLGHATLIEALDKARDSYNTDILSQAAAVAALRFREAAEATWRAVIDERQRVTEALEARGLTVMPSHSNFVLATVPDGLIGSMDGGIPGRGGADLYESLKAEHIFVRYFDQDRLRDKVRITIGTPQQNDQLLAAIDTLLAKD